jgi:hypothetical protein
MEEEEPGIFHMAVMIGLKRVKFAATRATFTSAQDVEAEVSP